jgi:hypothetical protein
MLGLLLSALLVFYLATTVLQPLAIVVLPAPLIFAYTMFSASALAQKGIRVYLVCCMAAAELYWIWLYWSRFVRPGPD